MSVPDDMKSALKNLRKLFVDDKDTDEGEHADPGLNATVQVVLMGDGGRNFIVKIVDGHLTTEDGLAHSPDLTLKMETSDFHAMRLEQADPMALFLSGRIHAEGDKSLAMHLRSRLPELRGMDTAIEVKETFPIMRERFDEEKAEGLTATFQLILTGEGAQNIALSINNGQLTIAQELADSPDLTMEMDTSDYLAIVRGEVDPMKLVISGRIKPEGDKMLAMRFQSIFDL